MLRLLSIAIVAGSLFASALAGAIEGDAPVRAHLEISGCATYDAIAGKVSELSKRIAFVGAARDLPTLRGSIDGAAGGAPTKDGVRAELTVVQPTGRRSYRSVSAPSCDVAADALAFLITMTLDPAAAAASSGSPLPGTPGAQAAAGAREGAAAAPASAAAAPRADVAPRETIVVPAPPPAAPAEAAASREDGFTSVGAAGLLAGGSSGPAPGVMADVGVYGLLGLDWSSPLSLSPAIRVSASHAWRSPLAAAPDGTAHFSLTVIAVDLCAVRVRVSFLSARVCGSGRVGRLSASGTATFDPGQYERFDASIGGAVLVTAALPANLEVGAFLQGGWALTRHEFSFVPQLVYTTPTSSLAAGLTFGRRFP